MCGIQENLLVFLAILNFAYVGLSAEVGTEPSIEYLSQFPDNGSLLEKWEPPLEMSQKFVYYLCGYTPENSPIWVLEWGKWDVRSVVESGDEELKMTYDTYVDQMGVHMFKSIEARSRPEEPVTDLVLIVDMENFSLDQLSSTAAMVYNLKKLRQLEPIARVTDVGFVVNTNFVAERVVSLLRPIFGNALSNFQMYGTNKDVWVRRILKEIPRHLLPPQYGGSQHFKPLKVYG